MKYSVLVLASFMSLGSFSQNTDSTDNVNSVDTSANPNSTDIIMGNVTISVNDQGTVTVGESDEKKFPNVEVLPSLDLGVSGYSKEMSNTFDIFSPTTASLGSITTVSTELDYSRSRNFGLNLNVVFNITKNFGIVSGFGLNYNSYAFKENLTIAPKTGSFTEDTVNSYNKYKFKNNYVQVPVMLKFQTTNTDFQFAVGGIVGYNFRSKVKGVYSQDGTEYKFFVKDNFNVNPLKVSLGARFNYKGVGLYFNYGITELLEGYGKIQGEQLQGDFKLMPFEAGITFGVF